VQIGRKVRREKRQGRAGTGRAQGSMSGARFLREVLRIGDKKKGGFHKWLEV
jgi:hypothetical protein